MEYDTAYDQVEAESQPLTLENTPKCFQWVPGWEGPQKKELEEGWEEQDV